MILPSAILALLLASAAPLEIYVSPHGDDAASGMSSRSPLRTLERAKSAVLKAGGGTVYLMTGVFNRSEMFLLPPVAGRQQWRAAPGEHPALDGGGKTDTAIGVVSNDVLIDGLELRDFTRNGIVVSGGSRVTIAHNYIHDITSSGWNQAGILGMQVAPDATIEANRLANLGYAGIQFAAGADGDLSRPHIVNNDIRSSCRVVADCGAIYLSGRTSRSGGAMVDRNRITDYGPAGNETKAIYLDDGLSDAIVRKNNIAGRGSYAVHIHGGRNNLISRNSIRLGEGQKALFYQRWKSPMEGNHFVDNILYHVSSAIAEVVKYDGATIGPDLAGNKFIKPR
jgi:hypothetical protein